MKLMKFSSIKICFLLAIVTLSACSDDETTATPQITEEEAVEIVESSMQKSTAGVSETTRSYSEELETETTVNKMCDTDYDSSFSYSYNTGSIQANYSIEWSYRMTCNNLSVPQSVILDATTSGTYSTTRIQSTDSSEASYTISGLQPSSDVFLFNGKIEREGNQILTTQSQSRSLTSTLVIEIKDVSVDKKIYAIQSGTGDFTLTGISQGNAFSFTGTIVFKGNKQATVTINGSVYEISLG